MQSIEIDPELSGDHFNPEAVHANIADPAYGFFFGQRTRRYTADFDIVF
jgi:hypothetical protein